METTWRLPGSPPRELELMEEVVSSFEDHQGQKQREAPEMAARSWSTDIQPQGIRTPRRGGEKPLWKEASPR